MSAIKNANDILILKKRKKNLDCEASDYEFGFDTVPQKIVLEKKTCVGPGKPETFKDQTYK